ncbi:MAG TPA: HD domain-containing protein [Candidatus Cloacimonadota bacterium]|jgi:putative hydrolase of HD superfamily|nr:HD domain-containing protein [Candidatus Cloacimonadales bacterium]HPY97241.1 HD domain-containing protein [Candidatus Cloacimonadota bacterium]HQB41759.1 HD domain-containing protein [Candidatus Cloacimonadota bacterium]
MKKTKIDNLDFHSNAFGFYQNIFQLKNLYRQGWLFAGLEKDKCESVADHTFALAMLCLKYQSAFPETLETEKMLIMALIHDLPESLVGDIIPAEMVSQGDKLELEIKSLIYLLKDYQNSESLYKIWLEFEAGSSPTGRYVKQMDKIEMLMQALIYQNDQNMQLDNFFITTKAQMKDDFFIKLWESLFDEYIKKRG